MVCVKFGLITEETDVEDLINMVQTTGKQVEESSKVGGSHYSKHSKISNILFDTILSKVLLVCIYFTKCLVEWQTV